MLHLVFDSDADTDPDTDACGNGKRAGLETAPFVKEERRGDVLVAVPTPFRRR
jgi:hypothetical protein